MKKIIFAFVILTVSLNCSAEPKLNHKQWQQDLKVYSEKLTQNHIDPFHKTSELVFNREINKLKSNLDNLTRNQILVELMKLTHQIGDGHTSFPLWSANLASFPVQLKMLNEKLYVVKATENYKHLLGAELITINQIDIKTISSMFQQLVPFAENKYSSQSRTAQYLTKAELLNGLGVIESDFKAKFTFNLNNKVIAQELEANHEHGNHFSESISYQNHSQFTIEEKLNDNLWFGSAKNKKAVYFKFRRYTSIDNMASIGEALLAFINKNQSEKLIIDLRDNYGGDFFVGLKLAQFLVLADSIDWKSGVYVLIDHATFSAAMSNAAQFSQLLNAKLVGEPTGAKPSGYQDMGQFILPNSKLEVTYSKRLYHFKENQTDALYPDIHIGVSIEDYHSGHDPQLQWILEAISKN
jgi:hypothetical protein